MSNLPVNPNDYWENTNIEQSDFAIPRVVIGQRMSDRAEPGKFNYNNGTTVDEIIGCTLIVPRKSRVLYGASKGSPSRCSSDNFYEPSSRVQKPISTNCLTCYAAQWGTNDPAKVELANELNRPDANKPLCAESHNLLMADYNGNPFFITFQKTQIKLVQEKLYSRLRQGFAVPPYLVNFDMKIEEVVGAGGNKYYSVAFDNFRAADNDRGKDLYIQFSSRASEILAEQHAAMDSEKDEVPF